jgi:hypothetical protein
MNQYLIQQKINTISDLCIFKDGKPEHIDIDGIEFIQWDFSLAEGCIGNAWIASGKEIAENYRAALFAFRKILNKIVPKIAFIGQCYMDYVQESFLLHRINDNPKGIAFIHYNADRSATGLMFGEEEKNNLDKLTLESDEFFWYMNDCYNTTGYTAKLLLMFAALESLAGKVVKVDDEGKPYETYNKKNMKQILGKSLYNTIYGSGGLRHKLTHGKYIDPSFSGINHVDMLHRLILDYFNRQFGTELNLNVVNPQRHPFGNNYHINTFLKPKKNGAYKMTLKEVVDDFKSSDALNNQSLNEFEFVFDNALDSNY